MKSIIKKIFIGICTIVLFLTVALSTYGIIIAYIKSLEEVGIWAILTFVFATMCLAMLLYTYYIIGDAILHIREKNIKKD